MNCLTISMILKNKDKIMEHMQAAVPMIFTITSKWAKYLRIFKKLNQQTRRLVYYKLQNISERIFFKYTNKWKGISSSQIEGIDVKILIIPKSIYKHNTIPIKMPWYFLHK